MTHTRLQCDHPCKGSQGGWSWSAVGGGSEDEQQQQATTSGTRLLHSYYEKPVTSKLVMMESTALPKHQKYTTLTQEVIRRMKNTSRVIPTQERVSILQKFLRKMEDSGYNKKMREDIIRAGLKGYFNKVERELVYKKRVNRHQDTEKHTREVNKVIEANNWFRNSSNSGDRTETPQAPQTSPDNKSNCSNKHKRPWEKKPRHIRAQRPSQTQERHLHKMGGHY